MITQQSGQISYQARKDYEALGGVVPTTKPSGGEFGVYKHYSSGSNVFQPEFGCEHDGYPMPCETKQQLMAYLDRVATAFGNRIEREVTRHRREAAGSGAATQTAGDRASIISPHGGGQVNAEQSASNSVAAQDGAADNCTFSPTGSPLCIVQSEPSVDNPVFIDASVGVSDKITLRNPLRETLDDFLANNPDCLALANTISKEKGLGNFKDFARKVAIIDISKESELLDKTFAELGGSGVNESILNSTIRNILMPEVTPLIGDKFVDNVPAMTVINANIVIVNTPFIYTQKTNTGAYILHEVLFHAVLGAGHSKSLRDYAEINEPIDSIANRRLTDWINDGCKKKK